MTSSGIGLPARAQYVWAVTIRPSSTIFPSLQFRYIHDTASGRKVLLWLASHMHLLEVQPSSYRFKQSLQQLLRPLTQSKRGGVVAETLKANVAKLSAENDDMVRMAGEIWMCRNVSKIDSRCCATMEFGG